MSAYLVFLVLAGAVQAHFGESVGCSLQEARVEPQGEHLVVFPDLVLIVKYDFKVPSHLLVDGDCAVEFFAPWGDFLFFVFLDLFLFSYSLCSSCLFLFSAIQENRRRQNHRET